MEFSATSEVISIRFAPVIDSNVIPTEPVQVLHVTGGMNRAGVQTMLMNLYRHMDRSHVQFNFAYFTAETCDFDNEIGKLGGKIFKCPRRLAQSSLGRTFWVWKLLRQHPDIKIVHSHTLFNSGQMLAAARLAGIQVRIAHSHSTHDSSMKTECWWTRIAMRRLYQSASRTLISLTATNRISCGQDAGLYLFGKHPEITYLPNGIEIREFLVPADELAGSQEKPELLRILQVARLETVKNHSFSLQIAQQLVELKIDFQMDFAGDGALAESLKQDVHQLNLEIHVRFLGTVVDIPSLMHSHDVLILPSLYEGLGIVLIEAQAAGLPAVVSDQVPLEADVGLSIIKFLPLSSTKKIWAQALLDISRLVVPGPEHRRQQLLDAGFEARANAKLLEDLYLNALAGY